MVVGWWCSGIYFHHGLSFRLSCYAAQEVETFVIQVLMPSTKKCFNQLMPESFGLPVFQAGFILVDLVLYRLLSELN